jgi:signal transduction histidine kinase
MTDVGSSSGQPDPGGSPPALPAGRGPTAAGRRLAALLAPALIAGAALLAVAFAALAGERADALRAAGALDRAARGRDLHLAAMQHRDAVRDLLSHRGGRRDVDAAETRLERAARACLHEAGREGSGRAAAIAGAVGRGMALAAEALGAADSPASARARFEDGYAREVLPVLEDAARGEGDRARAALAEAQRVGRRGLALGAGASLLLLLALGPALILARRPGGTREGERLVAAAEARVQELEAAWSEREARLGERTRDLSRARADLAENVRRLADAQRRLMASDRLAALGHLAAAVAHQVNNPLSAVTSNLEFLAEEVRTLAGELRAGGRPIDADREEEIASAFGEAREASQRVARTVRDLRTISRGESEPLALVDLREAVEVAATVALAGVKHRVRVERQLGDVPEVVASVSRLSQVFLPVLIRAGRSIDARGPEARGTIRISAFADAEGSAVVEIEDDGTGMTPEAVAHLFDPFGPVESAGPALGPGLAVAHGIVTSLGGAIEVKSAVGAGTAVRVTLPPALAPARGERAPQARELRSAAGV